MRTAWIIVFLAVLVWSGIGPKDFVTWCLEVFPAVAGSGKQRDRSRQDQQVIDDYESVASVSGEFMLMLGTNHPGQLEPADAACGGQ